MAGHVSKPATPVQQSRLPHLVLGLEAIPPVAKPLQRQSVQLAVLALIERALFPLLMVLPPETSSSAHFCALIFGMSLLLPPGTGRAKRRSSPKSRTQLCNSRTLTIPDPLLPIRCYLNFASLFRGMKFPDPRAGKLVQNMADFCGSAARHRRGIQPRNCQFPVFSL